MLLPFVCVSKCVLVHHVMLATSEAQCHMLLRPFSQQPPREEWVKWKKRGKNTRYTESAILYSLIGSFFFFFFSFFLSPFTYTWRSLLISIFNLAPSHCACSPSLPVVRSRPIRSALPDIAFSFNQTFPPRPPDLWQSSPAGSFPWGGFL